ncbi:MAG TPA: 1-deoxy-D-xylulose-5-phosphate synthase [Candidatus Limnocylindrales bacterium]
MAILPTLRGPADLRGLSEPRLLELAEEIRRAIISTVATTGGHLGSSLGVVEITLALHRILESPRDRIVWDTGHQAYPHKLLTGRYARFGTLRQLGGIGGFPRRSESEHDVFDGGHAGTGLSIGAGLATARDVRHGMERIAVVVGDAALMSGLSLEALNDLGHRRTPILIVLNDNEMSISPSVGALSKYLSEIKLSSTWQQSKRGWDQFVERVPMVGPTALEFSQRVRKSVVSFAQPGQLFEDLGITYVGVVPGHDLRTLEHTFRSALALDAPVIVHVRTQKGRGYRPAEKDQVGFHGAALPPMTDSREPRRGGSASPFGAGEISAVATGNGAGNGDAVRPAAEQAAQAGQKKQPNYTHYFALEVVAAAREDHRIVAITAGMPTGTGLHRFQAEFPDRFVDVGIAEQHAVALATGIALGGGRPVVAIYATFLQRAFDQIVHDAAQNDQPVLIGVDRAGLVGEDGTSHQGMFSYPAHRQIPNLVIAAPKDEQELRSLVRTALAQDHPFALNYPRDAGFGVPERTPEVLPVGRGEVLREGSDLLLVGFGPIVARGIEVADALSAEGWSVGVINARFLKPLDRQLILDQARGKRLVVTLEEGTTIGGFGSAVLEVLEEARLADAAFREVSLRIVGIPGDRFVDHGSVGDLRRLIRLDSAGILEQVRETLALLRATPAPKAAPARSATAPA